MYSVGWTVALAGAVLALLLAGPAAAGQGTTVTPHGNDTADGPGVTIHGPENGTTYTESSVPLDVTTDVWIHEWTYSLDGGPNRTFTPNTTLTGLQDDTTYNVSVYGEGVATRWVDRYDSGGNDAAFDVARDAEGNVYVTGWLERSYHDHDMYTVKYDASGTEQWSRTFDTGGRASGLAVTVGPDGRVYVGGTAGEDFKLFAYNASTGATEWSERYDPGSSVAYGLAFDASGNLYVTGRSDNDVHTVKYNETGARVWARTWDSGGTDWGADVEVGPAGNVYVAGRGADSYVTIKYDATGARQWVRTYDAGGSYDEASAVAVDSSGGVYVTGQAYINSKENYVTIKYNATGAQQWLTSFDRSDHDRAHGIAVGPSGDVFVTGESWDDKMDAVTVKYDASDGSRQWYRVYDTGVNDYAYGVTAGPDGDLYVAGKRGDENGDGFEDLFVMRESPGTFADGPVTFTVDTPEPSVVPNPTAYPGDQTWARSGQRVTLNVTATVSGSDLERVTVDASAVNASGTVNLTHAGGDSWTADLVLDAATNGTYDLNVTAESTTGTVNASETVTVRVDDTEPSVAVRSVGLPAGQDWVRDGQQVRLNVSASDTYSGIGNVTVDASAINASGTVVLSKNDAGYWTGTVTPDVGAATGTYNLTVTGVDGAAHADTAGPVQVNVDNSAPSVTGKDTTYPGETSWAENGEEVTLTVSVADAGSGVDDVSVDVSPINASLGWVELDESGGNWTTTATVDASTGGNYSLNVSATDNASNRRQATGAVTVNVEVDEPGIEWVKRPEDAFPGQHVVVEVEVTDDLALARSAPTITVNGTTYSMTVVDDAFQTPTTKHRHYYHVVEIPDENASEVTYSVSVQDASGKGNATASTTLSVDSRSVSVRSPGSGTVYSATTVPLNVTSNVDAYDWRYRLDGGPATSFAPNASLSGLDDGTHSVAVSATTTRRAWSTTFDGTDLDRGRGVAVDDAGNVYVTGQRGRDGQTIKYGPDGTVLWSVEADAFLHDLTVGPSGDVYVTGFTGEYPNFDYYTARLDGETGAMVWNVTHADEGATTGVAVDVSGNVYVTGEAATYKYDASGTLQWSGQGGDSVAMGPSGDVYVVNDSAVVRLDAATGGSKWAGGAGGRDVAVDSSGDVYVVGTRGEDYRTARYDGATGAELWNVTYDGGGRDEGRGLAIGPSGDVYVTGVTGLYSDDSAEDNYHTIRYDADTGTAVWHRSEDRGGPERGYDVAVGPSEAVYVTGVVWVPQEIEFYHMKVETRGNYHTVRYNQTDYSGGPASFTVDTTPPAVTTTPTDYPGEQSRASDGQRVVVDVAATDATTGVANVTVDASAINASGTLQLARSGGNWTGAVTLDRNATTGTYQLPVAATDDLGNVNGTKNVTVVVDNTPPAVGAADLAYPANQTRVTDGQAVTVTVNASDADAGVRSVAVNATAVNATGVVALDRSGGNWTGTVVVDRDAPSGTYNLTVRATDNATNVDATEVVAVTVDNEGPTVTSNGTTYPAGQRWVTDGQTVTVEVSLSDALSGVANASVDASPINASGSVALTRTDGGNWTATITPDEGASGTFDLTVRAVDDLGNVNTGTVEVAVDNAPPEPVDRQPTPSASTTDHTPTVRMDLSDGGSGVADGSTELWFDGANVTDDATIDATGVTYSPGTLADGTYTVTVHLEDQTGNERTVEWTFTVYTPATGDDSDEGSGDDTDDDSSDDSGDDSSSDESGPTTSDPWSGTCVTEETEMELSAGESATVQLGGSAPVESVDLTASGTVTDPTVQAGACGSAPEDVEVPALGTVYRYFSLSLSTDDDAVEAATVTTTVERSWIDGRGVEATDLVVVRHHDGEWERLPTTVVGESDGEITLAAEMTGFSLFAIVAEQRSDRSSTPRETTGGEPDGTATDGGTTAAGATTPSGETTATDSASPDGPGLVDRIVTAPVGMAVAVVALLIVALRWGRRVR